VYSGIVTAVFRFLAFLHVDIFTDVTYLSIKSTNWSIIEPGVYLMAATVPTLRPLFRRCVSKIAPGGLSRHTSRPLRSLSLPTTDLSVPPAAPNTPVVTRPKLTKKSSTMDVIETIGRKPTRIRQMDEYHHMQFGSGAFSVRSEDEESMVCVDAIIYETMGRQGRNPDGTLMAWSLQPIEYNSPLRTSFFFGSDSGRRAS
jgi:hypothetical protein